MLQHQVAYLEHFLHGIEIARGVVGVADEYALRARGNQLLESLHGGELEAVVDGGGYGYDFCTGRDGEGHVVGIGRFGDNYFVAGVEARHEGEKHGLRTAGGDDNIVDVDVDMEAVVVLAQLFAQRRQTVGGAVFEHLAVELAKGFEGFGRCGHVGLADVEAVHLDAALLGVECQRHKAAYG